MSYPHNGPPSGPQPQPPYGQQPYGPHSGPQPQQPYGQPGYGPQSGPVPLQQPYGQSGYPGMQVMPFGQPAEWGTRVLGYLIDGAIPGIGGLVGYLLVLLIGFGLTNAGAGVAGGVIAGLLGLVIWLAVIGFSIWNLCYRRGTTGQTIGQRTVKIRTISEEHGQSIGFGNAFLRQLCHILDSLPCNVGFLAPLWEDKNQTWADKIMRTVVVRADQSMPGGMPPAGGYGGAAGYYAPGTPGGGFPPQQPGYGPPPQRW